MLSAVHLRPIASIAPIAAIALVASLLTSRSAHAARPSDAACFAGAERGQTLRNEGKLLAARTELLVCSQASCPSEVSRDCARWLREVEDALPTVVLGASDGLGKDLTDVRVAIDEAPPTTTAEGRPIALDPGVHRFRFERDGSPPVERSIVLRAGEKNRPIVAELVTSSVAVLPASPAPAAPPALPDGATRARPVPVLSWVLGGVGLAGLGVFTVAGLRGVSHLDEYGCEAGCSRAQKSQVDTELRVADIGLVVGASALVAAAVVYLLRPTRTAQAAAAR